MTKALVSLKKTHPNLPWQKSVEELSPFVNTQANCLLNSAVPTKMENSGPIPLAQILTRVKPVLATPKNNM